MAISGISIRPLTNYVQAILQKTTLPEYFTFVVFDMNAYNLS